MQLAGYSDYLQAPARGRLAACVSGSTLGALGQLPNPYPNGLPLAGSGTAQPFRVAWYPAADVYVVDTGFGVAPIYGDSDFDRIWDRSQIVPGIFAVSSDMQGPALVGPAGANGKVRLIPPSGRQPYVAGGPVVINTSATGWQRIDYTRDPVTNLWTPSAAQGGTAGGASWFDQLIKMGAITGAAIAVGGTILGYATGPGPGATAVGGSAPVDVAAAVVPPPVAPVPAPDITPPVSTPPVEVTPAAPPVEVAPTPPEIATFTPPPVAAPPVVDVAPAINVAQAGTTAAAAATDLLSQVFSISKYIQSLASAYTTVVKLTAGTTHPQAGTIQRLPDGSVSRINPDGTTTVIAAGTGQQTTVGPGGTVSTASGASAGLGVLVALAAGALAIFSG